jgi:alpha-methylacyl-CoA racemase
MKLSLLYLYILFGSSLEYRTLFQESAGAVLGPLQGLRIIELQGLGPAPFCGMMLGDMGADVIQIVRPDKTPMQEWEQQNRGEHRPVKIDQRSRRSLALDLKKPEAVGVVKRLCENADGFIEGFRPGVAERLGVGPDVCMGVNPKLVYGRMTGWGQEGPLAQRAGHDINYLALSGAMNQMGRRGEPPAIPLNYVADYGGGGMMLAFGMVCALFEAQRSGKGQVVDAAMVDGVAALQAFQYEFFNSGQYQNRGEHFLAGGLHSYETYETKDGKYMSVGAIEIQFYAELVEKLGLDKERFADKSIFEAELSAEETESLKQELNATFKTRSQVEWCDVFNESDACVWPVLSLEDAMAHPHNVTRNTFTEIDGVAQHNPAPRFDRTSPEIGNPPRFSGEDSRAVLLDAGFTEKEFQQLLDKEVISVSEW